MKQGPPCVLAHGVFYPPSRSILEDFSLFCILEFVPVSKLTDTFLHREYFVDYLSF